MPGNASGKMQRAALAAVLAALFVVEEAIRIRTRERGHEAVMYPGDIDERKHRGKT